MQTEFRFASKKEKVKVDALIFGSVNDAIQPIRQGVVWILNNLSIEIVERQGVRYLTWIFLLRIFSLY
jgi:hypothetical protein